MPGLAACRDDFPILEQQSRPGAPLIYLDSAATSLKPRTVIEAISGYYSGYSANVHRGKHRLSELASDAFESARQTLAGFGGCNSEDLVFTRGATDGLNLVATALGLGSEELVLGFEGDHHSALLPFFSQARMELLPLGANGGLELEVLARRLIEGRPRVVVLSQVSNVTGRVQPVARAARLCREHGALLVVDGAQAAPHLPLALSGLDCDFYSWSAHKMLGPTGIGALWLNPRSTAGLPPVQHGGQMLNSFLQRRIEPKARPWCYEAGTPHIAGAIGFAAAARYLTSLGMEAVEAHGRALAGCLVEEIGRCPGAEILGGADGERLPVVSFTVGSRLHPDTIARILSERYNVMIRSGRHCADPLFEAVGIDTSLRAAAYLYNTEAEVAAFGQGLRELLKGAAGDVRTALWR